MSVPFLQSTSTSSVSPSISSTASSTPSIMNANKNNAVALPFAQQFDEIDRKILEFRRNSQKVTHNNHNHNHHNNNNYNQTPQQPILQQAQQFRLQQPLPQQQQFPFATSSHQQMPPQQAVLFQQQRRSNSLSPQYLQQQQQQQRPLVATPVTSGTPSIPSFPPPNMIGSNNLSTTSSISSASTTTSDLSNSTATALNSRLNGTRGSGSQLSSTFDDLLSPKFNPFGGNNGSFLNSASTDFSLNSSSTLNSNMTFKQNGPVNAANRNTGSSTNIWGNDMSVWR